jgi:hypothetical protein
VALPRVSTEEVFLGRREGTVGPQALIRTNALMTLLVSRKVGATFEFANAHVALVLSVRIICLYEQKSQLWTTL